ncbi:hypothetical protein P3T36_004486 [Kitasatospora sp. MAP12-15]|uniref:hypothetical protein n=1 Tax=unclassified Kitasatospora TaxID=2633591 RepID=UPI0024752558|nr:hypothetical protein [Kitasatospora sp. MAP12-44]MDH6110913.1 hypothetical protein [Kitasatospora sp. MAP12-44]
MSSGKNSDERNPFAPPPEDAPDQPWRPRIPQPKAGAAGRPVGGGQDGTDQGSDATGGGPDGQPGLPPVSPPHPWSPNWQGNGGPGWPERPQAPQQPRFDPNDPVHRRSRFALLSGMAALFSGVYGIPDVALLLGALALYWGISALRAAGKDPAPTPAGSAATVADLTGAATPSTGTPSGAAAQQPVYGQRSRPQAPAALGGLITGGVAVALVLGSFGLSLAYRPYFTCLNDALTNTATQSCSTLAPHWLASETDPQN